LASTLLFPAWAVDLTPVTNTIIERGMPAQTKLGSAVITARETVVDEMYPGGQKDRGVLVVLFDNASGFYLWLYYGLGVTTPLTPARMDPLASEEVIPFVADDRLVLFQKNPTGVWIQESFERAASPSDAMQRSLRSASEMLGEIGKGLQGSREQSFKTVRFTAVLGEEFITAPARPILGPLKLISVSKVDSGWEIVAEGRWKAKFTLNDKYEVTGAVRIQ
jgi:hypothetical protein